MPRWTPDGLKPIKKKSMTGISSYSFNAAEGLDLTAFKSYFFELEGVRPTTDNAEIYLRTSGNSGATDYDYAGQIWISSSTFTDNFNSAGNDHIRINDAGVGSVAANELGVSGTIILIQGGSSTSEPLLEWDLHYRDASSILIKSFGSAYRKTNAQITSVDIYSSDGLAFEQGEISIYGLRRIS